MMAGSSLVRLLSGAACFASLGVAAPPTIPFQTAVEPFIAKNGVGCHNDKLQSGGLNLKSATDVAKTRDQWEHVVEKLKRGEMPPKGMPRPAPGEVNSVTKWLEDEFAREDSALAPDPGRVTARRLNRYEYNATVRDLLAVDFHPADDFPTDDFGYGFDNIGDVLTLSPTLMEKYLSAARKISRLAIEGEPVPKMALKDRHANVSKRPGEFTWERKFQWDADYIIRVEAATKYPGELFFSFDGGETQRSKAIPGFVVTGRIHDYPMHLPYGVHKMTASFVVNEEDARAQYEKELADQARQRKRKGEPEPAPDSIKPFV